MWFRKKKSTPKIISTVVVKNPTIDDNHGIVTTTYDNGQTFSVGFRSIPLLLEKLERRNKKLNEEK